MSVERVTDVLKDILATEKAAGKNVPNYYPTYIRAVEQRDSIRVHADTEYKPVNLFKKRAPNQTQEQHDYVLANYRCTTNPVWQDYMTVIGRTFIDSNWAIIWPDAS